MPKGVSEILQEYSKRIISGLRQSITEKNKKASRKLLQSVAVDVTIFGDVYTMTLTMEDYWQYVEEGRKPGKQPPIEAIMKWTSQKGLSLSGLSKRTKRIIKSLKTKKVRKALRQISAEAKRRSLAFLIARKIGRKGIAASNFFSEVVNKDLFDSMRKDISEYLKKDFVLRVINY